jgi:hypothetical protein
MAEDRAGQLKMHIPKRSGVRFEAPIFAFDVEAAGEAQQTIRDENFPVITQVNGGHPSWDQAGVEQRHAHSLLS